MVYYCFPLVSEEAAFLKGSSISARLATVDGSSGIRAPCIHPYIRSQYSVRRLPEIELNTGIRIPILYEDRAVLAIDKPPGWMLIPHSWDRTNRNLQLALRSSINAGDRWARSRGLKFLRFVHRLDAETTGVLLFAKSRGALRTFTELFASRKMLKVYLAVVRGIPSRNRWECELSLAPDPKSIGRMKIDPRNGKPAKTCFQVLQTQANTTLVEARPLTGRTHQIRVHLAAAGHAVVGDRLYPESVDPRRSATTELALRGISLTYIDPFLRRQVCIQAPDAEFKKRFGFASAAQA